MNTFMTPSYMTEVAFSHLIIIMNPNNIIVLQLLINEERGFRRGSNLSKFPK